MRNNTDYKSMDFGLRLLLKDMVSVRSISMETGLNEIKSQVLDAYANGYNHGVRDNAKTRKPELTSLRVPVYQIKRNQ